MYSSYKRHILSTVLSASCFQLLAISIVLQPLTIIILDIGISLLALCYKVNVLASCSDFFFMILMLIMFFLNCRSTLTASGPETSHPLPPLNTPWYPSSSLPSRCTHVCTNTHTHIHSLTLTPLLQLCVTSKNKSYSYVHTQTLSLHASQLKHQQVLVT